MKSNVKKAQRLINQYNLIAVDGIFGPKTEKALTKLSPAEQRKVRAILNDRPTLKTPPVKAPAKTISLSHGKRVQAAINEFGGKVTVDGDLGSKSFSAYLRLAPEAKAVINSICLEEGIEPPRVFSMRAILQKAKRVADQEGVDYAYLALMTKLENWVQKDSVWVESWGTFRGVAQFDAPTWRSVSKVDFDIGTRDITTSYKAAAQLYKRNQAVFRRQFGPFATFSAEVAYLYHNQGAGGAGQFLRGQGLRAPGQSARAREVFEYAFAEINPGTVPSSIT